MFVPPLSAWRNPLAFPAGRAPSFDPTHPAAQGCLCSIAVLRNSLATVGGSPYNILNPAYLPPRTGSSMIMATDGIIGPALQPATTNNNSGQGFSFSVSASAGASFIVAALFRAYTFAGGSNAHIIETQTGSANAQGLLIVTGTGGLSVHVGASSIATGLTLAANVPYFCAASAPSGGTVNVVLLNLNTGQLAIASVAGAATTAITAVSFGFSSASSTGSLGGVVSHGMYGTGLMSPAQLKAWAYDFWLFWYPLRSIPFGVGRPAGTNYNLSTTPGVYTLSGNAKALTASRSMAITAGSYTLTGNAQGLSLATGHNLSAVTGSYVVTGNAQMLNSARKLSITVGSYTLTGNSQALVAGRKLAAATGAYTLSGNAVTFSAARKLAASAGAYTVSGNAATLSLVSGRNLVGSPGSYAVSGNVVALSAHLSLPVNTGVYSLSGQPAALTYTPAGSGGAVLPHSRMFHVDIGAMTVR